MAASCYWLLPLATAGSQQKSAAGTNRGSSGQLVIESAKQLKAERQQGQQVDPTMAEQQGAETLVEHFMEVDSINDTEVTGKVRAAAADILQKAGKKQQIQF